MNIICSGRESCKNTYSDHELYLYYFNNLFCNGFGACHYIRVMSGGTNIYAYGMYGARGAVIENIKNLYCGGYGSCLHTSIQSVRGDIFAYNYGALANSSISNITNGGTLYACGTFAVAYTEIELANSIIALGNYSLYSSEIINGFNKINATGYQALGGYASINNNVDIFMANKVGKAAIYCYKEESCIHHCQLKEKMH